MRAKSIPIHVAVHRFMETDKVQGYARATRREYTRTLNRLVANNPGVHTDHIEAHHLEVCLKDIREGDGLTGKRPGRRPGRGAAALNLNKSVLRRFIGWCQNQGYLVGNPAAEIERVRVGERRRFEDWVLTPEQVVQLLDLAGKRHPRDRMAVALGVYAGMRDSEICDLQWADVNWRTQELDFYREKDDARIRLPLNMQLLAELRTYYQWYQETYGAVDPHWFVVPSRWRSPVRDHSMTPNWKLHPHRRTYTVIRDVKALLAEVGMPVRPNQGVHVLRRTFAAMLLDATGDIRDVTVALGHSSQGTTERYLFRNAEADRLRNNYSREGFALGIPVVATPSGDNVVSLSSRRHTA